MSYTPNMEAMQEASKLVSKMISYVKIYEAAQIDGPEGFVFDLTPEQVNDLKQAFVAARTACKAELDKVTG